jgi:two-component system nitrogen regulation sensor histidine kinase GlnL
MKIATDEIRKIEQYIQDLMSPSNGNTQVIETDINELIRKLLFFTSYQFKFSNIQCNTQLNNIPAIRVNPFELGQAILNVLNNAIEAMNFGGEISINTYKDFLFEKEFVFLKIADTGPGMIQEGESGVRTQNSNEKGRGFGLLITRKIIEDHGGYLMIDSEKGVGTSVCFCLPIPNSGGPNELSRE